MTTVTPEQVLDANTKTQEHINLVRKLLRIAATEVLKRGEVHDLSKFSEAEVEMYAVYTPRLRSMEYNSPEYKQCLAEMRAQGGLTHHYEHNRHHPEFFGEKGINGMNLVDLLEMYIDWYASSRRGANGSISKSIEANKDRFKMSDQLVDIFKNTAADLNFEEP